MPFPSLQTLSLSAPRGCANCSDSWCSYAFKRAVRTTNADPNGALECPNTNDPDKSGELNSVSESNCDFNSPCSPSHTALTLVALSLTRLIGRLNLLHRSGGSLLAPCYTHRLLLTRNRKLPKLTAAPNRILGHRTEQRTLLKTVA